VTDPYESPTANLEPDLEPLRPGPLLVGTAIALLLAGVLAAAYALQLMIFVRWDNAIWLVPATFGALGVAQVLLAAFVARGQAIPVGGAAVVSALQALIALAWLVATIFMTLFSPLGLCWLLLSLPPVLLLPIAMPRAIRVSRARRALYHN